MIGKFMNKKNKKREKSLSLKLSPLIKWVVVKQLLIILYALKTKKSMALNKKDAGL